jgi:hypothetical protein
VLFSSYWVGLFGGNMIFNKIGMRNKLFITSLLIVITMGSSKAQSTTSEITTEFFKLYSKSPTKAVGYAFSTNIWIVDRKKDAIENVKSKLSRLIEVIGDYSGYEKIVEKSIGDSLKLESYLIKYSRQPLRFTFIFYKSKDVWQVQNFSFDDSLDEELEEAGRVK